MDKDNFDWEQYVESYSDLKETGMSTKEEAWDHWINHGQYEGRNMVNTSYQSNEYLLFDWEKYIITYKDLLDAKILNKKDAWNHWIKYGNKEERKYFSCLDLSNFNWEQYLENYEDLRNTGINTKEEAWKHWINAGIYEGRTFYNVNLYSNKNEETIEGVNLITYYGNYGLGQIGIIVEQALQKIPIKVNLIKITPSNSVEKNMKIIFDNFNYNYLFVIFSFNYDNVYYIDNLKLNSKYIKISLWAWELDNFPNKFLTDNVNELWTLSDYSCNSIGIKTNLKLTNIKPSIIASYSLDIGEFGYNIVNKYNLNNKIIYLIFFDVNSSLKRKNPFKILDIFLENNYKDKILLVKISNSTNEIKNKYKSDNIIIIDEILDYNYILDLYRISDIFVCTSTCEGQGRSILEALQFGLKIFAIEYSAIKEFSFGSNITFIKHDLVKIDCDQYNNLIDYDPNYLWGDINKNDLQKNIELINNKPVKNLISKENIEELFSINNTTNIIKERLFSLKKKYVDTLVANKINKYINLNLFKLTNNHFKNKSDIDIYNIIKKENFCYKYLSYKTSDVKNLLSSYYISFENNSEYFDINQSENISIKINEARKCIFTTSNINYISRVNVLVKSILKTNCNIDIYNVIVDDYSEQTKQKIKNANFKFIPIFLDELDIDQVRNLKWFCYQYNVTDLNTAAKPFAFKYLFNKNYDKILYFDSDIEVFSSLDNLFDKLTFNSFVLTPHITQNLPDYEKNIVPNDNWINRCGIFNLGFIGISKKQNGLHFVNYWCSKTNNKFIMDFNNGLFTDQIWCNFIPTFYNDYYIERSLSYNIAYWNLFYRDHLIDIVEKKINNEPIVFIHYSGVTFNKLILSKHQNLLDFKNMNFKYFHNSYIDLIENEIRLNTDIINIPYKFNYYEDQTNIIQSEKDYVVNLYNNDFNELIKNYKDPFSVNFKNFVKK